MIKHRDEIKVGDYLIEECTGMLFKVYSDWYFDPRYKDAMMCEVCPLYGESNDEIDHTLWEDLLYGYRKIEDENELFLLRISQ